MGKLKIYKDYRGFLMPMDIDKIPFIPRRVFVVGDVPKNTLRGNHAHYKTEQFLVCVSGKIEVGLYDGEKTVKKYLTSGMTLYIKNLVWDYQIFLTGKDVLLVYCSTVYSKKDYITNKSSFEKLV